MFPSLLTPDQMMKLVARLTELTEAGKLRWLILGESYFTTISDYAFTISLSPGDCICHFRKDTSFIGEIRWPKGNGSIQLFGAIRKSLLDQHKPFETIMGVMDEIQHRQ